MATGNLEPECWECKASMSVIYPDAMPFVFEALVAETGGLCGDCWSRNAVSSAVLSMP